MKSKPQVLFIDSNHPSLHEGLTALGYQCLLWYDTPKEDIESILPNITGIVIRSRFKLDEAFLAKASQLKFIARAGAGMENIAVTFANAQGIACLHAPEGNRDAVAEQAVGMLLCLFTNLMRADAQVRKGIWIREGNRGCELMGKTVGIIGYGNMGSAFAQRLQGFGVNVLAYDKYKTGFGDQHVQEVGMDEIFEQADVLSLHVPLSAETNYLVNKAFIAQFKKSFYLLNTARGKCVNTADLVQALDEKKILGACLDVLEYEALSFEQIEAKQLPEPFRYLINSDRVVLSPHIAGWTFESHEKIARVLVEKIATLKLI